MLSIHPSEIQHYQLPPIPLPLPVYYHAYTYPANTASPSVLPMPHRQPPSPASSVGEPALPSSWGHHQPHAHAHPHTHHAQAHAQAQAQAHAHAHSLSHSISHAAHAHQHPHQQPHAHHHAHHQHQHSVSSSHSGSSSGCSTPVREAAAAAVAADKERLRQEAAVAQALEIARESPDGASDPTVRKLLDAALGEIWCRVEEQPDTYVMSRHEFAIFNFFQHRFAGDARAQSARKRYWDNARA